MARHLTTMNPYTPTLAGNQYTVSQYHITERDSLLPNIYATKRDCHTSLLKECGPMRLQLSHGMLYNLPYQFKTFLSVISAQFSELFTGR